MDRNIKNKVSKQKKYYSPKFICAHFSNNNAAFHSVEMRESKSNVKKEVEPAEASKEAQSIRKRYISLFLTTLIIISLMLFAAINPKSYLIAFACLLCLILLLILNIGESVFTIGIERTLMGQGVCNAFIIILVALLYHFFKDNEFFHFLAVLLPLLLIQIFYDISIVKISLNISRLISLIILFGAEYLGFEVFKKGMFVVNAIIVSLVFGVIVTHTKSFHKNDNK